MTKTEIINLALSMLGANLITDPTDDSDEAQLANLHYEPARDSVLELQEWQFAIKRFTPAASTTEPLFGWGYAYPVPEDILRVLTCDNLDDHSVSVVDVTQYGQIDWIIEGNMILANESAIYVRGVRRVESEALFSPNFVYGLATRLAVLMAIPLTQSNSIFDKAVALHNAFLSDATSRDSIQGRNRRIRNRTLMLSR